MQCKAIRDPVWKHIHIIEPLADAMFTCEFVRLSRIRQLGPTEIVYPGAVHTRASHSIGVYGVARRLLEVLEQRGAGEWLTKSGKVSWYAAALFHDIGHFPYTHSLKELPLAEHESLSAQIVLKDSIASCISKAGGSPEQTAAIIDKDIPVNDSETLFYRRLLSGVLDPDKLDYLNRDAYYCGVPYGVQDTDFVLECLYPDKEKGITIDSTGILAVENLLFSKYMMYRSVYWHKQVRIATAMMKKTLYSALTKGLVAPEELYQLDDNGIYELLEKASTRANFLEASCAECVRNRQLYTVVDEVAFDEHNELHCNLELLEFRSAKEKELAEKLGIPFEEILIDVPERISFESDLWVQNEKVIFSESSTIFSPETVKSFTSSLRKIRIAVKKAKNGDKKTKGIVNLL